MSEFNMYENHDNINYDDIIKRINYLNLFEWSRTEKEDNELKELTALLAIKAEKIRK